MGSRMDNSTCLELALEGERLCKCGDFSGGVAFFEAAIKVGTSDMRTLSAIYSQLGNAYFYLSNYEKALNYHQLDLSIAKSINDAAGEAKASGNLGNTYKMLSRFKEAIDACNRHLEISHSLKDRIGEGRALYNIANIYHTMGKKLAESKSLEELPEEAKQCLMKACHYYHLNLDLMIELGDKAAQGRSKGNLGNIHYLLGNFKEAVKLHTDRLQIAQEFSDKPAERRARCNLGNARIFLGQFEEAINDYSEALRLAIELNDQSTEAQTCYSLANTYNLLCDYNRALQYHLRYLELCKILNDKTGESRACLSISNAYSSLGEHEPALKYANGYLKLSQEMEDESGQEAARQIVREIEHTIQFKGKEICTRGPAVEVEGEEDYEEDSEHDPQGTSSGRTTTPSTNKQGSTTGGKRLSMSNMQLLKMTPRLKTSDEVASSNLCLNVLPPPPDTNEEDFFDLLMRYQGNRLEDQRSVLPNQRDEEERAGVSGSNPPPLQQPCGRSASAPEEDFFTLIHRVQSNRLDDQRTSLPVHRRVEPSSSCTNSSNTSSSDSHSCTKEHTKENVPDDEFISLILKVQAGRLDDQRTEFGRQNSKHGTKK